MVMATEQSPPVQAESSVVRGAGRGNGRGKQSTASDVASNIHKTSNDTSPNVADPGSTPNRADATSRRRRSSLIFDVLHGNNPSAHCEMLAKVNQQFMTRRGTVSGRASSNDSTSGSQLVKENIDTNGKSTANGNVKKLPMTPRDLYMEATRPVNDDRKRAIIVAVPNPTEQQEQEAQLIEPGIKVRLPTFPAQNISWCPQCEGGKLYCVICSEFKAKGMPFQDPTPAQWKDLWSNRPMVAGFLQMRLRKQAQEQTEKAEAHKQKAEVERIERAKAEKIYREEAERLEQEKAEQKRRDKEDAARTIASKRSSGAGRNDSSLNHISQRRPRPQKEPQVQLEVTKTPVIPSAPNKTVLTAKTQNSVVQQENRQNVPAKVDQAKKLSPPNKQIRTPRKDQEEPKINITAPVPSPGHSQKNAERKSRHVKKRAITKNLAKINSPQTGNKVLEDQPNVSESSVKQEPKEETLALEPIKEKKIGPSSKVDLVLPTQAHRDRIEGDWYKPDEWNRANDIEFGSWTCANEWDTDTLWDSNHSQNTTSPTDSGVSTVKKYERQDGNQTPCPEPDNKVTKLSESATTQSKPPRKDAVQDKDKQVATIIQTSISSQTIHCFNCWNYGHTSRACSEKRRFLVEQEELRVKKNMPLHPMWNNILVNNGMTPMVNELSRLDVRPEVGPETEKTLDVEMSLKSEVLSETKNVLAIVEALVTQEAEDLQKTLETQEVLIMTMPSEEPTEHADQQRIHTTNNSLESIKADSGDVEEDGTPVDKFFVDSMTEAELEARKAERRLSAPPSYKVRRVPRARKSAEENLKGRNTPERVPVMKLPNEILTKIFRYLFEADFPYLFLGPLQRSIFSEEKVLYSRNVRLQAVRQTCNVWRAVCQRELYENVSITSLQGMVSFTTAVKADKTLASFVRCLKIEISLNSIAAKGSIRRGEHEEWADIVGENLIAILEHCQDIRCLVAYVDGGLRGLNRLRSDYPTLAKLSIKDGLIRRREAKYIWKVIQRFTGLETLEVDYTRGYDPCVGIPEGSWDPLVTPNLEALTLRNISNLGDQWLEILPKFRKLTKLSIEDCRGVSPGGLGFALCQLNDGQLEYLKFVVWSEWSGPAECPPTLQRCDHMCDIIPRKFGNSLVDLYLSPLHICEMIFGPAKWEKLQSFRIKSIIFRGCTDKVTEKSLEYAVKSTQNKRLIDATKLDFGIPHLTIF